MRGGATRGLLKN